LTATGSKYVFYIHGLDTNQVYYSKLLVDKGWQGFAVFFVCAFLFSILVAVVFCLFNFDMFV
ncbi:hypothetical protein, partial [Shewanella colwelliana]|uniref:hypothetical protein n=1 Tax=Shewanella colwelliana TaxID=23 RepID=UPI001C7D5CFB